MNPRTFTPDRTLRRVLRRLGDRLSCVASAAVLVGLVVLTLGQVRAGIDDRTALQRDFGQDYLLARAFADGVDPYVPVRSLASRYLEPTGLLVRDTPTPHPPSVALLVLPLTLLGYTEAVRAWLVAQFLALLVGVYLTLRGVGQRWAARLTPPLTALLLFWPAVDLDLVLGQSTSLLLALLAAAQLLLVRRRTRLAGAVLGASLLLKPLAWPWLLVLAAARLWAALGVAVVIAAVGWTLPAVRFGVGPMVGYFTRVLPMMSALYASEVTNLSWWTVGPRLFRGTEGAGVAAPPLVDWPFAATLVGLLLPVVVLGVAIGWLVLARPQLRAALGVCTAIALIVTPISWAYYLGVALLPVAAVARALSARGWPVVETLAASMSVALLIVVQGQLIQLARGIGGGPSGDMTTLGSVVTLAPGVGVAGLAAVLALCDWRLRCSGAT